MTHANVLTIGDVKMLEEVYNAAARLSEIIQPFSH